MRRLMETCCVNKFGRVSIGPKFVALYFDRTRHVDIGPVQFSINSTSNEAPKEYFCKLVHRLSLQHENKHTGTRLWLCIMYTFI